MQGPVEPAHLAFFFLELGTHIKFNRCIHTCTCICNAHVTGDDNSHHYFVASQDPELRGRLRELPGVPLLHIIRNTMILEKPSDSTHDKAERVSEKSLYVDCGGIFVSWLTTLIT